MSRMTRLSAVATAFALAILVPPSAARAAEPAVGVPAGGVLTLTGHGYGHGRGMSQYGAEGAARRGLTAAQILGFYYPGTSLTRIGGKIRVRIGADTTPDVVVGARTRLVARVVGSTTQRWALDALQPAATRWRLRPLAGTRSALSYRVPGGRWTRAQVLVGTAEFFAGGAPITLYVPGGAAAYRGALRSAPVGGDRDTVNVLGLQNFVRGVVAREMPAGWSPAALQAQAVAARTYAAYDRAHASAGRAYDTCDSTSCQVYGGVAAETRATDAAIAATDGQVLTYAGQVAFTQFSASNGGWTVGGTLRYQAATADPYDAWSGNRVHTWTTTVSAGRIQAAWPKVGRLTSLQVTGRDGNGEWGGRVTKLRLVGTAGTQVVGGSDFRDELGLRSTWFLVRP